jgi:protein-L-isoaspartate(D-aspartate) O-methyltransferase
MVRRMQILTNSISAHALLLLVSVAMISTSHAQDLMERLRERMVRTQIENRGIKDPAVLEAMRKVKRHQFVPESYASRAYGDHPLPIGEGQTISQPYIVALMTEVLNLKESDKVLEIGTGSGYQAAILGELCDSIYTIEIVEVLGKRAANLLNTLGYENIEVKVGDGYKGWPEYAPFDAIIVTCSPTQVPQPLQDQLTEGGRMVIPVGRRDAQELVLLTKQEGKLQQQHIIPVRFVPMVDSTGATY